MAKSRNKPPEVQTCLGCGRDTRAKNGICALCWGSQSRNLKDSKYSSRKTIEVMVVERFPSGRCVERIIALDVVCLPSEGDKQIFKLMQEDGEMLQVCLRPTTPDSDELYHGLKRDDI